MATEIKSYRDLDAWQVAMDLVLEAYPVAARLPQTERYELSAQIRRAAVSVPANVAEGQGTGRDGRFMHHLRIALGSLAELETHFEGAVRLGYVSGQDVKAAREMASRAGQLLNGLLRSLRRRRLRNGLSALSMIGIAALGFLP